MLTGSNAGEIGETGSSWQMNESDGALDDWFTKSTHQLRRRTAREGAWVNQPSREIVERLINWFHDENSQAQQ